MGVIGETVLSLSIIQYLKILLAKILITNLDLELCSWPIEI